MLSQTMYAQVIKDSPKSKRRSEASTAPAEHLAGVTTISPQTDAKGDTDGESSPATSPVSDSTSKQAVEKERGAGTEPGDSPKVKTAPKARKTPRVGVKPPEPPTAAGPKEEKPRPAHSDAANAVDSKAPVHEVTIEHASSVPAESTATLKLVSGPSETSTLSATPAEPSKPKPPGKPAIKPRPKPRDAASYSSTTTAVEETKAKAPDVSATQTSLPAASSQAAPKSLQPPEEEAPEVPVRKSSLLPTITVEDTSRPAEAGKERPRSQGDEHALRAPGAMAMTESEDESDEEDDDTEDDYEDESDDDGGGARLDGADSPPLPERKYKTK